MARGRDGGRRRRKLLVVAVAATVAVAALGAVGAAFLGVATAEATAARSGAAGAYAADAAGATGARGTKGSPDRRQLLSAGLAAAGALGPAAAVRADGPKITAKCSFDITIGYGSGAPRRVVIGLFGEDAPVHTNSFLAACTGTVPGAAGVQARYQQASVRSISTGRAIAFANFPGGNFMLKTTAPSRGGMVKEERTPLAGPETKTDETNSLRHDELGRVSMAKGGGSYNFVITPVQKAPWLDANNVVIGQVLEGLDVIEDINKVRVTPRGGIVNAFDRGGLGLPADAPENAQDYLMLPLERVRIVKSRLA